MEEILVCCGSIFVLAAVLFGVFSFAAFTRQSNPPSTLEGLPSSEVAKDRQEAHRSRLETLLALIGMWLALPAICNIFQGMVDTVVRLDSIANNKIGPTIKLVTDGCLLGVLISGLVVLILVTITTWSTSKIGLWIASWLDSIKARFSRAQKAIPPPVPAKTEPVKEGGIVNKTAKEFFLVKIFDWIWARMPAINLGGENNPAPKNTHESIPAFTAPLLLSKDEQESSPALLEVQAKVEVEGQGISMYIQKVRKKNPNFP
jgi:hypothetical protein